MQAGQSHVKEGMNSSQRSQAPFSFPDLPALALTLPRPTILPLPVLFPCPTPEALRFLDHLLSSWSLSSLLWQLQPKPFPGNSWLLSFFYPNSGLVSLSPRNTYSVICPVLFLLFLLSPEIEEEKGQM